MLKFEMGKCKQKLSQTFGEGFPAAVCQQLQTWLRNCDKQRRYVEMLELAKTFLTICLFSFSG